MNYLLIVDVQNTCSDGIPLNYYGVLEKAVKSGDFDEVVVIVDCGDGFSSEDILSPDSEDYITMIPGFLKENASKILYKAMGCPNNDDVVELLPGEAWRSRTTKTLWIHNLVFCSGFEEFAKVVKEKQAKVYLCGGYAGQCVEQVRECLRFLDIKHQILEPLLFHWPVDENGEDALFKCEYEDWVPVVGG